MQVTIYKFKIILPQNKYYDKLFGPNSYIQLTLYKLNPTSAMLFCIKATTINHVAKNESRRFKSRQLTDMDCGSRKLDIRYVSKVSIRYTPIFNLVVKLTTLPQ